MEAFKKVMRGYDEGEVNAFLAKLNDNFADVTTELKSRIAELKNQNEKLLTEIANYKNKEKLIERTMTEATRRANDIENELKTQYALEIERLKIFQAKWTNCYEELKLKYHFDKDANNMESLVISTKQSLIDKLANLNIVLPTMAVEEELQFRNESERIAKIQAEQADKLVDMLRQEIDDMSDGFSMEEALNPTQTLDELCREMGLTKN